MGDSSSFTVNISNGMVQDSTTSANFSVNIADNVVSSAPQPNRVVTAGITPTPTPIRGRLDTLDDVVESGGVQSDMTLVYDQDTDKYVVKYLDVDGGTF